MEWEKCKIEYIAVNSDKIDIKEFFEELYVEPHKEDTNYVAGFGADFDVVVEWKELPSENVFTITGNGKTESGLKEFKKMFEAIGDEYFEFIFLTYDDVGKHRCIDGYKRLHTLENEIRIFILKKLISKHGHVWWEDAVPKIVRQKGWNTPEKLKQKELNTKIFDSENILPLIYYTNFGDLKKIIEDENNWDTVFKQVFENQGVVFKLEELDKIRNKIAHNRYLTDENKGLLQHYYSQLHRFISRE